MNGKRAIKKSSANQPVKKSIRVRKEKIEQQESKESKIDGEPIGSGPDEFKRHSLEYSCGEETRTTGEVENRRKLDDQPATFFYSN